MTFIKSEYPPDWKEIRARILERSENKCEFCGDKNHSINKKGTRVVLSIAHLDHDYENWNVTDDRLKALCDACRLKYDLQIYIECIKYGRKHRGPHQLKLGI